MMMTRLQGGFVEDAVSCDADGIFFPSGGRESKPALPCGGSLEF